MTRLYLGTPLWIAQRSAPHWARYPRLERDLDVDAVVVGGGLTGAAVAWTFASAGIRVAVLEQGQVGCGSTAANSALLMQEPDRDLSDLSRRYGHKAAIRIWTLGQSATRELISVLRTLRIACDLRVCDSIYYGLDAPAARLLRSEFRRRRTARLGGRWLEPPALLKATGIHGSGGIRTRGNAYFDPLRACRGLLKAAQRDGARIFEQSPVVRIEQTPAGIRAVSGRAAVHAHHVIVATGYATSDFRPSAGAFRMKHTYVQATAPIPDAIRRELGLRRLMLWDSGRPYHYARWTHDHRLLLGGEDRGQVAESRRRQALRVAQRELRKYFETLLPPLSAVRTDHAWEGLFAMTPDSLPYIGLHRRYPHHLFALGYGGNGMTFAYLAARLLLDYVRDGGSDDLDLFAFGRLTKRRGGRGGRPS